MAEATVWLPYGSGKLKVRIPEDRLRLVEPVQEGRAEAPLDALRKAMGQPTASPSLEDLAAGRRVTFLVDDATRSEPHEDFIRAVLERLGTASSVRGIIAVGSHERFSPGNRRIMARFQAIAGELGLRAEVSVHDCQDPSLHVQLGRTSRGTPVEVSRHALEADVLVVTSDLKNHYFAGYSNPLKSLLPGVSSFASIEKNHSLALEPDAAAGRHPWHPDAGRRANPVAEDMLEAARMVTAGKAVFVLACVSVPAGLVWARAGEMEAVTRQGIAQVDHTAVARVSAAPFLIVSPGGTPEDETLYNAQRGLELSRDGVQPGGEVLFVARCDRGAAPTAQARAEFYDRLKPPLQEVIAGLKARYILYSHKAFKFAQFIQSVRRICMVTDLSADEVSAAHMERAADPQAVVDGWLRQSHAPIIVSTQANRVVLRS